MDITLISQIRKSHVTIDTFFSGTVKSRLLRAFLPLTIIIILTNILFFALFLSYLNFHLPYIVLFASGTLLLAGVINFFIVLEITRSVGGMLDAAILEKSRVQEKLLSQKLFYENILNKIPVDVAVYDLNFKYIYCNPSTIRNESERDWIIGRSDLDYCILKKLDTRIAMERESLFSKAVSRKFAISLEQNYQDENGEPKYTLRTIAPASDGGTADATYISFGFDITSLKLQEETLRNKNIELEKTNFELDRFVYSASHDLKAPLSSVLGLINLSKREAKDQDILGYLEMMEKSIKKLDKFIKDLIHFSRNTRLEVKPEPLLFESIISERVDDLRYMEDAEKVRLEKHIQGTPFWSDENRISTIFNNLISNSVKYYNPDTEDPCIKINIETNTEKAIITIRDNGRGIDSNHIDRIFDMFYRASEHSQGSGLGLYIVKEIVRKLEGSIQVESEKGNGSLFTIILPNLIQVAAEKRQTEKQPESVVFS